MFTKKKFAIVFVLLLAIVLIMGGCSILPPPTPNTYTIISTAGENGNIDSEGEITIIEGDNQSFIITADEGYLIADILVDGLSVLVEGESVGSVYTYTFGDVQQNHTIHVIFVQKTQPPGPGPTPPPVYTYYTITATAGTGGSIQPEGIVNVIKGSNRTFTITPDGGYQIENVVVDGTPIGPVAAYTFTNVQQNHTIQANFIQTFVLTMAVTGDGEGNTDPVMGTHTYPAGTVIDITATPSGECCYFDGWGGGVTGTDNPTTITMDSDKTVTANFAARIVYNITQDINYTSIQDAIDNAVDNDVIVVCPGEYYEKIDFLGKDITLRSTNPEEPSIVESTIIDGSGSGSVVIFENSETAFAVLSGFTIRNGNAFVGGGIYMDSSSPTITGNNITGNTATGVGGGIYMDSSSPTITGNNIINNTAVNDGGGIYMSNSFPTIEDNNNISENNSGRYGAGIYVGTSSSASIIGNIITGNQVSSTVGDAKGGGIIVHTSTATIMGNEISGNTATTNGGGIYIYNSTAAITGNDITDNTVTSQGGGIYMEMSSPTIQNNNIIRGNEAALGGGIYMDSSSPTITGNTIDLNTALTHGGGIYMTNNSSPDITDNDFTGNTTTNDGGGIYVRNSSPIIENYNNFTENTAGRFGGGIYVNENSDLLPNESRPDGWGSLGDTDYKLSIPADNSEPGEPIDGPANNTFSGNRHGAPSTYSMGAHVLFMVLS